MDPRIKQYVRKCRNEDRRLLTEAEAKELLDAFDIPVVDEAVVTGAESAVERAESLGYPVVLKGVSPDVPHKSEAGIIELGVESPGGVREAFGTIRDNLASYAPDARFDGVLVQSYTDGEEVLLGMNMDQQFGPVVVFGLGGVFVEIFDDVTLRLPPIDQGVARTMIENLQSRALLTGARGEDPRDVDSLIETITKFSEFVEAVDPYVSEVDVNPLMVGGPGEGSTAVDALVRLSDVVVEESATAIE